MTPPGCLILHHPDAAFAAALAVVLMMACPEFRAGVEEFVEMKRRITTTSSCGSGASWLVACAGLAAGEQT